VNNNSGIKEKLNTTVTGLRPAISTSMTYRQRANLNPYSPSSTHSAPENSGNNNQANSVASGRLGKLRIDFPDRRQQRAIERRIFGLIRLARQALDPVSVAHRQAAPRDPVDAVVVIEAQVRHGPQRPGQVSGGS
jgi:hypothetical protein